MPTKILRYAQDDALGSCWHKLKLISYTLLYYKTRWENGSNNQQCDRTG